MSWWIAGLVAAVVAALIILLIIQLRRRPSFKDLGDYPSQFVQVGEFDVHYIQDGKGPHLLLIHGIGASTYAWRKIFPELTRHFRVTAIDLPGFGRSSKPGHLSYDLDTQTERIKSVLDQLHIHQCRVVGSSMGGTLALWMGLADPKRFFELAVISPALRPDLVPAKVSRLAWTSRFLKVGVSETLVRSILKRVLSKKDLIDRETVEAYLQPYVNSSDAVRTFIKATETVRDPRLQKELSNIKSRVLAVWGKQDKIVPVADLDILKRAQPHLESYIHDEAGHHVMEDEPQWLVQVLVNFFKNAELH